MFWDSPSKSSINQKLIISYCLFTPKKLNNEIRFWDPYANELRYWYNIPALVAINQIVYPMGEIWIYLSEEIKDHPLFEILIRLKESFTSLNLIFLDYPYENTEPTLWRYKPVFDCLSDIIICRDLDSLPNEIEIKATNYFIENPKYYIQTLRTHTNHRFPITTILAGLSAFRPKQIDQLKEYDFETFYHSNKSDSYGLDQGAIIKFFTTDLKWTKKFFLDCVISSPNQKPGKPLIPCVSLKENTYKKKKISEGIPQQLVKLLNNTTEWGGEPIDFRGEKLKELLDVDHAMTSKLKDCLANCSLKTKIFYQI